MTMIEQGPAETFLRSHKIPFEIAMHEPTETALAEARALHLPFDDVLKTVMLRVGDEYRMAIVPASRRLDVRLIRRLTDEPVRLATENELQRDFAAYELGAIPPLPGLLGIKAFVDQEVLEHNSVAFADGRRTESMIANPRVLFWGQDAFVARITTDPLVEDEGWRFEGDAIDLPDKEYFA